MQVEPLRSEYRDRDAAGRRDGRAGPRGRAAVPHARLRRRAGAAATTSRRPWPRVRAFNRWLEEDWGFAYQRPDHRRADALARRPGGRRARRSSSLIERGARMVHIRPAPVPGPTGRGGRSATRCTTRCGRAWPRPSIPVAFHLGDSGYNARSPRPGAATDDLRAVRQRRRAQQAPRLGPGDPRHHRRASSSTACSPATRRCGSRASRTARTGWSCWSSGCDKQANQTPWVFPEDPARHPAPARVGHAVLRGGHAQAWPTLIGVERVLFGSDWPHGEGLGQPDSTSTKELQDFSDDEVRAIMRDNCLELLGAGA